MNRNTKIDRTGNRYCGPLVLAALLNCSTAEAAAKVRGVTGSDRAIKGMSNSELIRTLTAAGYSVTELNVPKRYVADRRPGEPAGVPSFGGRSWRVRLHKDKPLSQGVRLWEPPRESPGPYPLDSAFCPVKLTGPTLASWLRDRPDKSATYIVNVTGHYVLISGRKFVDTASRGEWVNIGKAPHRRARVVKVWRVER